jgi:hypothetical protein
MYGMQEYSLTVFLSSQTLHYRGGDGVSCRQPFIRK